MRKFIYLFVSIILLLLFYESPAQNLKIGLEGGPALDFFDSNLEGNEIFSKPLITEHIGLAIRKTIQKNFIIETGLSFKGYKIGYGFNKRVFNTSQYTAFTSLNIPIRFHFINKISKKMNYRIGVGYQFCFNFEYYDEADTLFIGNEGFNGYDVHYVTSPDIHLKEYFHLLDFGLGLDILLSKHFSFDITFRYNIGFEYLTRQYFKYNINNTPPEYEGFIHNNGNSMVLNFGIFYLIN